MSSTRRVPERLTAADFGFDARDVVQACRRDDVRFSVTARMNLKLRAAIEAVPEQDWRSIPYWLDGGAAVPDASYTPFADRRGARPVRLIVRRTRPTPSSQLDLFGVTCAYHPFITDRHGSCWPSRPTIARTRRSRTSPAASSTASAATTCHPVASVPTPPGWPSR